MAKSPTNPFGPDAVEALLDAFPVPQLRDPVRAGRPRLLESVTRMGQGRLLRAWASERSGKGECRDVSTCTVLADVVTRVGGEPVPAALRESSIERQGEALTRVLRDLARGGCERVALVGVRNTAFAAELLSVLDRSVLQVMLDVSPDLGGKAPDHWERIRLETVSPQDLTRWTHKRMRGGGIRIKKATSAALVQAAGPKNEDVLQLAAAVYRGAQRRGRAKRTHVERAIDGILARSGSLIARTWETLSPLQQNLMRAMAAGEPQLFAAAVRKRFGLRSTASVARSLELLGEKGLVERTPDAGYRFESPWVAHWVVRNALPDVGIPGPPA